MTRNVLILGATGLVGRELLTLLAADSSVGTITVIARRSTGHASPKIREELIDLDRMAEREGSFAVDEIFCALGTTIRQAGSQEAFRKVDYEYPLEAARLGLEHGASHLLLVSALGANSRSRVFYNRVKGELEDRILELGYPSVTIARPSLLLGPRAEKRRGEEVAKHFGWLMPSAYKPIDASAVARALADAGQRNAPGVTILDSRDMRRQFS